MLGKDTRESPVGSFQEHVAYDDMSQTGSSNLLYSLQFLGFNFEIKLDCGKMADENFLAVFLVTP